MRCHDHQTSASTHTSHHLFGRYQHTHHLLISIGRICQHLIRRSSCRVSMAGRCSGASSHGMAVRIVWAYAYYCFLAATASGPVPVPVQGFTIPASRSLLIHDLTRTPRSCWRMRPGTRSGKSCQRNYQTNPYTKPLHGKPNRMSANSNDYSNNKIGRAHV